jgi:hypothetical protein
MQIKEHGFELSEGCCMVQERKYAVVMLGESIGECGCGVAEDRSLGEHEKLSEFVD